MSTEKRASRVVKVGGSLFAFDQLPERVQEWVQGASPGACIFIAGGGDLVQPLRSVHDRFRLTVEASHWLAVRAMTVTSRLLAKLLNVELVEQFEILEQRDISNRPVVLDVEQFLRQREPEAPGCRLPLDWTCTGDSIAARVAEVLGAEELVLMKSVFYPPGMPLEKASEAALVDGHFPQAVRKISRLTWVNLLSRETAQNILLPGSK